MCFWSSSRCRIIWKETEKMVNIFLSWAASTHFREDKVCFFFFFSCYDIYIISVDSLARLYLSQVEKYIYFRWKKKKMGRNHKGVRATTERKAELWLPSCLMKSLVFKGEMHCSSWPFYSRANRNPGSFVVGEGALQLSGSVCYRRR